MLVRIHRNLRRVLQVIFIVSATITGLSLCAFILLVIRLAQGSVQVPEAIIGFVIIIIVGSSAGVVLFLTSRGGGYAGTFRAVSQSDLSGSGAKPTRSGK